MKEENNERQVNDNLEAKTLDNAGYIHCYR